MADARTIDKIRKLVAKATNNSNSEEAATAFRMAHKLIAQHGLNMADFFGGSTSSEGYTEEEVKEAMRRAARRAREEAEARAAEQQKQAEPEYKESAAGYNRGRSEYREQSRKETFRERYERQKAGERRKPEPDNATEEQVNKARQAARDAEKRKAEKAARAEYNQTIIKRVAIAGLVVFVGILFWANDDKPVNHTTYTPPASVERPVIHRDVQPAPVVAPAPTVVKIEQEAKEFSYRSQVIRYMGTWDDIEMSSDNHHYSWKFIQVKMNDASTISFMEGGVEKYTDTLKASLGKGVYSTVSGGKLTIAPKGTLAWFEDKDGKKYRILSSQDDLRNIYIAPEAQRRANALSGNDQANGNSYPNWRDGASTPWPSRNTNYNGKWYASNGAVLWATLISNNVGDNTDRISISVGNSTLHSVGNGVVAPEYSGSGVESAAYQLDDGTRVIVSYHRGGTVSFTYRDVDYSYRG